MKVRIPKLSKKQTESVREAVTEEMARQKNALAEDMVMQMLYVLHFKFGFGKKRLTEFAEFLTNEQVRLQDFYEFEPQDVPFLCKKKLVDDGIDVDKIIGE